MDCRRNMKDLEAMVYERFSILKHSIISHSLEDMDAKVNSEGPAQKVPDVNKNTIRKIAET